MNKILIATNNKHKVNEIKDIICDEKLDILTPGDLKINIEVKEDMDTLEGNALKKAAEIYNIAKIPTLADDTGLYVRALNGEPGVFSSRYAGLNATYHDNCEKLKLNMKKANDRLAFFKTIICYITSESQYYFFEGYCKGSIAKDFKGENGFGYDPLFIPDGFERTYAEMSDREKNLISHRGKAFFSFKEFLKM